MFFEQRWYTKKSISRINELENLKGDEPISALADVLYQKDEKNDYIYDIVDLSRNKEKQTALQKINMIWFFFVYWMFFAPYQYVSKGVIGFDQKTKSGKIISKLIGKISVSGKVSDYKSGWSNYISKEDFLKRMEILNLKTLNDFKYRYDYEHYFENDDFLIEKVSEIYKDERTKMNRFNEIWLTALLFVLLPFVGTYRWFKFNDFGYDQNGKIVAFYKRKTGNK